MCVILHRLPGTHIDTNDIIDAYDTNPDGYGLMYQSNNRVVTEKGLIRLPDLISKIEKLKNKEFVLHLRIRTHGKINQQNCHPFSIGNGGFVMHNGILEFPIFNKDMSDTWHFSNTLKSLGRKLTNKDYKSIEEYHGKFNRMVFMYHDSIVRTGEWHRYEDNYWSNLNWQFVSYGTQWDKYDTYNKAWSSEWSQSEDNFDHWYYKD